MKKNILIIGGNGYIGSYLTKYLQRNTQLLVHKLGSRVADYNNFTAVFLQRYDYIVLLAGHSSVQMCNGDLSSPWNNNVRNFDNLVKKLSSSQKLIYASSSSVYGNKGGRIFTEDDLNLEFINNYDLTKTSLDLLASNYINDGKKIIGLRFGTVNGSSPLIRRDLMLNSMIYSALNNGVIKVNNKHVNRPILAIKDLSRAIETILTSRFNSGIYNLASFNSDVKTMANVVKDVLGVDINDTGDKPGVYDFITSTEKFCETYKFTFKENIDTLVEDVVQCYKDPFTEVVKRDEYFNYS